MTGSNPVRVGSNPTYSAKPLPTGLEKPYEGFRYRFDSDQGFHYLSCWYNGIITSCNLVEVSSILTQDSKVFLIIYNVKNEIQAGKLP